MCIDFTDLNKCCSKDDFPLSRIDKVVDSAVGCETMVLLDYFSGYYQIWLRKEDKEKTSFLTPFGTYCYLRMLKGLNNAGPTFCRMTRTIQAGFLLAFDNRWFIKSRHHLPGMPKVFAKF
jgi:hypothetical protein